MMVAVDPSSMSFFADNGVLWPWPRDMWAQAIEVAGNAGAAGIIFDVMFDDPGIERTNSPAHYTDQQFADKLAEPFPSVICAFLTPGDEAVPSAPAGLEYREKTIPTVSMQGYSLLLPYQTFRTANLGLSNTLPDKDGVIRSAALAYESNGVKLPTLALRAVEMMNEGKAVPIRLDDQNRLWLRYYDKGGPGGAFPYISAASLITGTVPSDSLKGKILIVGGFAIGLLDFKPTPVADIEHVYPGFEIHATLISNLLQNDGLVPAGSLAIFIMTFLLGIVGLIVFRIHGSVWFQVSYVVFITVAVLFLMYAGFMMNTLLPVTSPLLACYTKLHS